MEIERARNNRLEDRKQSIKTILEILAKSVVDSPNDCRVEITNGESTCVFEIHCAKSDMGQLVGKEGAMAKSLRTFSKSLFAKNRVRAVLEICD
jgi:uncharacterized protein